MNKKLRLLYFDAGNNLIKQREDTKTRIKRALQQPTWKLIRQALLAPPESCFVVIDNGTKIQHLKLNEPES